MDTDTKKRIYVGLLGVSLLLTVLIVFLVYFLVSNRQLIVNQVVLFALMAFVIGASVFFGIGIIALVIMIKRSKSIPALDHLIRIVNEFLFPLTLVIGRIFGIKKEKIMRSFIEVNNHIVGLKSYFAKANQIMILLPHCMQNSQCNHKITADINNCRSCGKCKIGDLIEFAKKNRAILKVATGGTMARKYIIEEKPQAIIAVACERDLTAGIQDSAMIPVMGVLNRFTKRPCEDTDVDLEKIEQAFQSMLCKGG